VFENSKDLISRIDSEELDVTEDSVLVLKGIGPVGNPGMPEAGMIPIPRKLARQGVADMLRISDGRMSGTAGGTIILHVSPESTDPDSVLGIVKDGDYISCNLSTRTLHLEVSDAEIQRRRVERAAGEVTQKKSGTWKARKTTRGYRGLYERNVNQAHKGCDFDFLSADGPASAEG